MSGRGFSAREYENLVRDGITAARGGRLNVARRLLNRAASQQPADARVWLWLSATTSDPHEQRQMLEKAVAADPANTAAKRGLAILGEKLGEPVPDLPQQSEHIDMDPPGGEAADPVETVTAETFSFDCPNCGGRMQHEGEGHELVCEYCGFGRRTPSEQVADSAETPIDPVLRTEQAHLWAASVHEIECEKCGAHVVEAQGLKSQQCPYCGSNQFVESHQTRELVGPQAIALFRVKEKEALEKARDWLGTGLFAPDDLQQQARQLKLRPAYYPFWTFDGGVDLRWNVEVRENYSRSTARSPEWRRVEGSFVEFFDDVLVSGVSALKRSEIAPITPFDLKDVVAFAPEHLAGWTALAYDRPLSDASVLARKIVLKRLRPRVRSRIEPGKEKRDIRIHSGRWSGVTYKHVLLPIWIGTYRYRGEEYHVLVNGQTGKAGGQKPRDSFKVAGIWLIGILGAFLLLLAVIWLLTRIF